MKISEFVDSIYHSRIYVAWDYKPEEIVNFFKRKYNIEYDFKKSGKTKFATCFSICNKDNSDVVYFILVPEFEWTIQQQGLFIHEIYHLVNSALRDVGLNYSKETEEAYAYYLQYVVTGVFRILLKSVPRKKKGKK